MPTCKHVSESIKLIKPLERRRTVQDIFEELHTSTRPDGQFTVYDMKKGTVAQSEFTCKAVTSVDVNKNEVHSDVDGRSTIGDVTDLGIKSLIFTCTDTSLDIGHLVEKT
jgi:hypothetical protein